MNDEEINIFKLKVPSQLDFVTPNLMRKFIELLPKIPDTFENNDVTGIKEFSVKNEDALARVLAYFKYLGILTEERIQRKIGEETKNKQLFHLTDKGKELKQTAIIQPDDLDDKWTKILKTTELYNSLIKNEEFQGYGHISRAAIRKLIGESFSKNVKNPRDRVDLAEEFLKKFLKDFNLFTFDGDFFKPIEISKQLPPESKDIDGEEKPDDAEHETNIVETGFYIAKTADYELKVKYDELAIEMLEMQIGIAKKKLKSMKKQNMGDTDNE